MKLRYAIIFLLCISSKAIAQIDQARVYTWEEAQFANPDTIFKISFSKSKSESLPSELSKFKSLTYLDLSKNKLNELPEFIGDFQKLEFLDISKNDFNIFPVEICRLSKLKILKANRNEFDRLPDCIVYCSELEEIDLWETPIMKFPDDLNKLEKLKKIDLQGIKYGPTFQKQFKERNPKILVLFDPPCDCME